MMERGRESWSSRTPCFEKGYATDLHLGRVLYEPVLLLEFHIMPVKECSLPLALCLESFAPFGYHWVAELM